MKKKLWLGLLIAFLGVLCAFGLVACGGGSTSVKGTYYFYKNGNIDKSNWIELNSDEWKDCDGLSGTYEVSNDEIVFYVDLLGSKEIISRGTVKDGVLTVDTDGVVSVFCKDGAKPSNSQNTPIKPSTEKVTITYNANGGKFTGDSETFTQSVNKNALLTAPDSPVRTNYTFAGWATSKNGSTMWKFDEDRAADGITLWAKWTEKSAAILSVDGASIDGNSIFMLVDRNTDAVSLSGKVVCSSDSVWRLYYDRLGQTEIPTKMAAGLSGYLANGNNVFYMVVTSQDGVQTNLYELTVHRSYAVSVNYYNGVQSLKSESVYTGSTFTANYTPQIEGYTFNGWKDGEAKDVREFTVWGNVSLFADKTANNYTVRFNVNGGNDLSATKRTVTYDNAYKFAAPTRTGYSFSGWYYGSTQVTDTMGNVSAYKIADDVTLTAKWEANTYTLTLKVNDSSAGTVTGSGEYAYDSNVTIKATTNNGYNFLGWYDTNNTLISESATYTFKMGLATTYTAKWDYYTVTATRSDNSAGTLSQSYNNTKVVVGTRVTITAKTNDGYTWIGWYNGAGKELTQELTYTFTMQNANVNLEARWTYYTVTATRNDTSAGSLTKTYTNTKVSVGTDVTLTAKTNSGYTWLGWYNGNEFLTEALSYTFTMEKKNVNYEAKWTYYTVTTTRNNTSAGTVSVSGSNYSNSKATAGTSVSITAKTIAGYTWVGWYKDDIEVTTSLTYTFTMGTENVSCEARWTYYTISTTMNDTAAGTLTKTYANEKVSVGSQVTLTAKTNNGYTWLGWYNGDTRLSEKLSYMFTMEARDVSFEARWTYYTLTTKITNSEAGTLAKNYTEEKVSAGTQLTLTARTNVGYNWIGWYDSEGTELTTNLSYTFVMEKNNMVLEARWDIHTYTVSTTLNDSDAGTLTKTYANEKVSVGSQVTLTAKTNNGYTWLGWYSGDTRLSEQLSYTFTMEARDVSFEARWTYYTLTTVVNNSEAGTLKQSYLEEKISAGNQIALTAQSNLGYVFAGWYNNGTQLSVTPTWTFTMEKANVVLEARWSVDSVMENFEFTSTALSCRIINVIDKSVTNIIIPNYVVSIDAGSLKGCSELVSLTIPFIGGKANASSASLTTLFGYIFGTSNFDGATATYQSYSSFTASGYATTYYIPTSLTNVTVTGGKILYGAFYNCNNLTSVTIQNAVTSIGGSAFYNCSSLTDIILPDTITEISQNAFSGTSYYNNTSNWEKNVLYIGKYLIEARTSIVGSYTVDGGTMTIADSAFYNCSGLTSITIPDTVVSIGRSAFENCTSITSATLSSKITVIEPRLFYKCSNLTKIKIPDSVTLIDGLAFEDCTALTTVEFGTHSKLTEIDEYAFCKCSALKSITLPSSVRILGYSAFNSCISLTSINIPSSMSRMNMYVFHGCTNLKSVTFATTTGWKYSTSEGLTGTAISSTDLSIPTKAATLLTSTYCNYYWKRG